MSTGQERPTVDDLTERLRTDQLMPSEYRSTRQLLNQAANRIETDAIELLANVRRIEKLEAELKRQRICLEQGHGPDCEMGREADDGRPFDVNTIAKLQAEREAE